MEDITFPCRMSSCGYDFAFSFTHTHTYTHTYIHTYTHTYIHTYIQNPSDYLALDINSLNTMGVSVTDVKCSNLIGQQIPCSPGAPSSPEYSGAVCSEVLLEVSESRIRCIRWGGHYSSNCIARFVYLDMCTVISTSKLYS